MLKALKIQGISDTWINFIEEIYTYLEAKKITNKQKEILQIKKGVKQEDPLSPILFKSALEEIFRKLKWTKKGIKINRAYLKNLRIARVRKILRFQ